MELMKENNILVPVPAVDTAGKKIPVNGVIVHICIYTPKQL
jgi:acetyl esterase